ASGAAITPAALVSERPSLGRRSAAQNIDFECHIMSGDISRAVFSDVSFGGVLWNESPLNGHPGLMLSSLDFNKCRFDGGWFRGTGSVGVRFTNCRFQGTSLDVRNMGATS